MYRRPSERPLGAGAYGSGVIDTHCHLTFPDFQGRIAEVIQRAQAQGVTGMITISTTTRDCLDALAVAKDHPNVWCTSGVHPLHAHEGPHEWGNIVSVARDRRCVAWGELGLDNHYQTPTADLQRMVLEDQLDLIVRCSRGQAPDGGGPINLPVVIHCREAFADLIPILRASGLPPDRMVFHCFTGGPDEARMVLDFGAWISFTGVATYRNAEEVRQAARLAPADRIMVETDAPFLSPEPKRGQRPCEPWMASLTAHRLAEVRGEPWMVFHERINRNSTRFFGVP